MKNTKGQIKPEDIIEIILRRRWVIIIPFCISMVIGLYLSVTLPKIYEASTLILVEAQRVPEDYVQSVVSSDIDARINTISQQILSRTNLEKIIKQLDLFSGATSDQIFMEEKVQSIRKRISVDVTRSRRDGADSFTVSYKGRDPEKVKQVVNTLTSFFIDENLKVREAQAVGTSNFLEEELTTMRVKLERVEENMKDYRKRYMGELPEQLESNLRILDRLQEQIAEARNRLMLMEQTDAGTTGSTSASSSQNGNRISSIDTLKRELADLQTKYTDKHPDIIRLKRQIANYRKKRSALLKNRASQSKNEADAGTDNDMKEDTATAVSDSDQLANWELSETDREIINLKNEISELKRQAEIYKKRVENTPKREQELMSLQRDYQNIQDSYSSLLSRKLEAEISVNMEQKQKGERFRVIDPAKLPQKPVEPDMKKLFLFVLIAGLGIGGGLTALLEYQDTTFRKSKDIESYLGIPVIAKIPPIKTPGEIRKEKINMLLTYFSLAICILLFAGFTMASFMDHLPIFETLRNQLNG